MKLYLRLIYIVFIYLISNNKWTFVESADTSPASEGRDNHTSGTSIEGLPATPPSHGKLVKKIEEASSHEEDMYTDPNEHSMRGGGHGSFGNDPNEHGMRAANHESFGSGYKHKESEDGMTAGHPMKSFDRMASLDSEARDGDMTSGMPSVPLAKGGMPMGRDLKTSPDHFAASDDNYGMGSGIRNLEYDSHSLTPGSHSRPFGVTDPNEQGMTAGHSMRSGASESGTKTGVSLNLKINSGTTQFNYKKSGYVVTFTAKDDYAFKLVKQGSKEIWKTDKESEYATKVVLNGKGKKKKTVTITLLNGNTKSYKKDSNTWSEVSQNSN